MREKKKSYLDLFLDNNSTPKKREKYFLDEQEQAIIKYNKIETSSKDKNSLFRDIIDTCFKKTISGVLEMPNFRRLPTGLNREELVEMTYFRLVEKIHRFEEGMISKKTGLKVKAFSFFSTIAKNYILEQITKHNRVLENKADVETSIDLTILSEDTLSRVANDNIDLIFTDYITSFALSKDVVLNIIRELIIEEESKEKSDEKFIKLGYCLKYLLEKWDKIEFKQKNEFMRILTLYTGLPQQKVSFLFKRFKNAVLKKIKPSSLNKKKKKDSVLDEEEEIEIDVEGIIEIEIADEFEIDDEEITEIVSVEIKEETEEEKIMKYNINSLSEWEARESKLENAKNRHKWEKNKKLKEKNPN